MLFWPFGTVPYNCYNSQKNEPIGLIFLISCVSRAVLKTVRSGFIFVPPF